MNKSPLIFVIYILSFFCLKGGAQENEPNKWHRIVAGEAMSGTELLDWEGDFGQRLMEQAHQFLDRKIAESASVRDPRWNHSCRTAEEYRDYLRAKRESLAYRAGIREPRTPFVSPRIRGTLETPPQVMENNAWKMIQIEWDVFDDYAAKGILIEPKSGTVERVVIALGHEGVSPKSYFLSLPELQKLAAEGKTRIIIPAFLNREVVRFKKNVRLPRRELIYREAYLLGRHLIGYEIETVRAAVDWVKSDSASAKAQILVGGYGDGGMLALYCGALDDRIDEVRTAGYFGDRSDLWRQPLDRNLYGLLNDYGDAELAAMIFPRKLVIEKGEAPTGVFEPVTFEQSRVFVLGAEIKESVFPAYLWAPAEMCPPAPEETAQEFARLEKIIGDLPGDRPRFDSASMMTPAAAESLNPDEQDSEYQSVQNALLTELDAHTQAIMRRSADARAEFMNNLDASSAAALAESGKWYRDYFHEKIAGRFDEPRLPFHPRSRKVYDEERWVGYDVVLDVFDGLSAYGLLVLPKGLAPGEKRPVVVFQHGREGCPDSGISGRRAYNAVVPRLVDRGYIVFCPQNLYIRGNEYRKLQQKCYAIGKTFFGLMIAQHDQIVAWLGSLPFVQPEKIGFYGISYGGKSAMMIPSVVTGYALSVCCGDFNERIVKCASTDEKFSFMNTCEYEMYEFDSGDTFSYAEMAMLIAPRPFMVERGRRDDVGRDEYVAFEFAKVARFYDLIPEMKGKAAIEYFDGGHEIHFEGVADFLDRFLKE